MGDGLIYANGFNIAPTKPAEPYYDDGNVYMTELNDTEEVLVLVMKIIGLGFWSITVSRIIRSVSVSRSPADDAYDQDMDMINRFIVYNHLPGHLARDLRTYLPRTKEMHQVKDRAEVYSRLSPLLVVQVTTKPLAPRLPVSPACAGGLSARESERLVAALVTTSQMAVWPGRGATRPPSLSHCPGLPSGVRKACWRLVGRADVMPICRRSRTSQRR